MIAVIVAHLLAGAVAPLLVRWFGTRAFYALAAVPGASAVYTALQLPDILAGRIRTVATRWIPSLDLEIALRMDLLAWVLTMVITGIGALVLLYCAQYFHSPDEPNLDIFAGALTAFAGAMVGVVTADDFLLLYVFWEATTILSYVLIGYHVTSLASTAAAKQALIITTAGGLAMLVGIVLIGQAQGTLRISETLADPQFGPGVPAGVALLLVGALTKSAQFPFHFWLPGAMAAPTPVSAYLHAASMVKAGVYLVARLAPAYATLPIWRWTLIPLGATTMLLGAYRSLRQRDLKLLLAYGTVSQLGFLMLLVGLGTRTAMLAGLALLIAHALFKATLFLTTGAIDHTYGTRDLSRLSGLARREPVLFVAGMLACASMAGLPPLLGFVAKESAIGGLLQARDGLDTFALVVVVVGSILTFAYSARFLWGAFGTKPGVTTTKVHGHGRLVNGVPTVLAFGGLVLGLMPGWAEAVTVRHADLVPDHPVGSGVHLALWHGVNAALLLSLGIWIVGLLLFRWRAVVIALQGGLSVAPDAVRLYQNSTRALDRLALEVTGWINRGSTPRQLGTILLTFVVIVAAAVANGVTWPEDIRLWDSPAQAVVGLTIVAAAVGAARARRRLRAVFLVGVTGYGMSLLFLLHGGPDLALTQILVETVSLIVFVLVMRRLSGRFPDEAGGHRRGLRAILGLGVGTAVVLSVLTAAAVRSTTPAAAGLPQRAKEYGGGTNIVNVILVDVRAWDTMGEISVVLAAATGIASLILVRRGSFQQARQRLSSPRQARTSTDPLTEDGRLRWLVAADHLDAQRRSTIVEVVTRLIFHTLILWSIYLLFAGHNAPGGGFAAGLVAGLALTLRYLAGRGYELSVAAPVMPGLLLGAGLSIAALSAVLPLFFGSAALRTWIFDVHLPLLGDIHVVTSLLFDIGVYLVVIGLILTVLRTLGTHLDELIEDERDAEDHQPTHDADHHAGATADGSNADGSNADGGEAR